MHLLKVILKLQYWDVKFLESMERQLVMSLIDWWHLNGEISRGVQNKLSEKWESKRDTDFDKLLNDLC